MIVLLILLAGLQLGGPLSASTHRNLVGLGDSNTAAPGWIVWLESYLMLEQITYFNAGIGGDTTQDMMARYATDVTPNYAHGAVCVILAGLNNDDGSTTADSIYKWVSMLCDSAKNDGFITLVSTYPMEVHIMFDVNTLIRASWATFADGLIDPGADAYIGEAADHNNATYFLNTMHFSSLGHKRFAELYIAPAVRSLL